MPSNVSLDESCSATPLAALMPLLAVYYAGWTPAPGPPHTGDYDFIVVGGGSAGCVVANRLSEVRHWKVLLLEAGPEEPVITSIPSVWNGYDGSPIDWGHVTSTQQHACNFSSCPLASGKVLGGSSAINAMMYIRGNSKIFDEWAASGNIGWSYRDVLPYFMKAETNEDADLNNPKYRGENGFQYVQRFPYRDPYVQGVYKAFRDRGFPEVDVNAEHQEGVMWTQATSHNGERWSTNTAYLKPVRRDRPNLTIITGARVTRVIVQSGVARGVEFRLGGAAVDSHQVFAVKEVVLSAGTYMSPQVLMHSGIGPQQVLQRLGIPVVQDLAVGRNLKDHVACMKLTYQVLPREPNTVAQRSVYMAEYLANRTGLLTSYSLGHLTAFTRSPRYSSPGDTPDIQYIVASERVEAENTDVEPCSRLEVRIVPYIVRPKSEGWIEITSKDPLKPAIINPNYYTDPADMDTMVYALSYAANFSRSLEGEGFVLTTPLEDCSDHKFGTDPYWRCVATRATEPGLHAGGTCKMGPATDPGAVVDPRLRVHGVRNLRVIDASIMPFPTNGNTNAVAIMIGEFAAHMVKQDWNCSHNPSV